MRRDSDGDIATLSNRKNLIHLIHLIMLQRDRGQHVNNKQLLKCRV